MFILGQYSNTDNISNVTSETNDIQNTFDEEGKSFIFLWFVKGHKYTASAKTNYLVYLADFLTIELWYIIHY